MREVRVALRRIPPGLLGQTVGSGASKAPRQSPPPLRSPPRPQAGPMNGPQDTIISLFFGAQGRDMQRPAPVVPLRKRVKQLEKYHVPWAEILHPLPTRKERLMGAIRFVLARERTPGNIVRIMHGLPIEVPRNLIERATEGFGIDEETLLSGIKLRTGIAVRII